MKNDTTKQGLQEFNDIIIPHRQSNSCLQFQMAGAVVKPQQEEIVIGLPARFKQSLFLNPFVPTIYIRPTTHKYNFLQEQMASPFTKPNSTTHQPQQQHLQHSLSNPVNITLIDSELDLDQILQAARDASHPILYQHYEHTTRSYKPCVCLQAIQILDTVYVIDTMKLGLPVEILQTSLSLKITSKVTQTSVDADVRNVIETGCSVL